MKQLRRTEWFEWRCDLDGCSSLTATHKHLITSGDETDTPGGWVRIDPPKYWKGASLAFCSEDHAQMFIARTVIIRPQLASTNG